MLNSEKKNIDYNDIIDDMFDTFWLKNFFDRSKLDLYLGQVDQACWLIKQV